MIGKFGGGAKAASKRVARCSDGAAEDNRLRDASANRCCECAASPRPRSVHWAVPPERARWTPANDKDLPLREDTRLLGRLLGDVLRAQTGDDGFARIEAIRQTAIRFRRAGAGDAARRQATSSARC